MFPVVRSLTWRHEKRVFHVCLLKLKIDLSNDCDVIFSLQTSFIFYRCHLLSSYSNPANSVDFQSFKERRRLPDPSKAPAKYF